MRGVPGTSNISYDRKKNRYRVIYIKNGKLKQLATGRTLIEALMIRDWCREHGWIPFIHRFQFIQKQSSNSYQIYKHFKQKDGSYKKYCFGCYNTIEDAIEERDLLIKYDWDFEVLCSLE